MKINFPVVRVGLCLGLIYFLAGCVAVNPATAAWSQAANYEIKVVEASRPHPLTAEENLQLRQSIVEFLQGRGALQPGAYYVRVNFPPESEGGVGEYMVVQLTVIPTATTYTYLPSYSAGGSLAYEPYDPLYFNSLYARSPHYQQFDYRAGRYYPTYPRYSGRPRFPQREPEPRHYSHQRRKPEERSEPHDQNSPPAKRHADHDRSPLAPNPSSPEATRTRPHGPSGRSVNPPADNRKITRPPAPRGGSAPLPQYNPTPGRAEEVPPERRRSEVHPMPTNRSSGSSYSLPSRDRSGSEPVTPAVRDSNNDGKERQQQN
jgi:hypothetical protein